MVSLPVCAAPPILNQYSHAGWMSAITIVGKNSGVGVMYFIGAAMWSLEVCLSFVTLQRVYAAFRSGGHSSASAQREAAQRAAAAAV